MLDGWVKQEVERLVPRCEHVQRNVSSGMIRVFVIFFKSTISSCRRRAKVRSAQPLISPAWPWPVGSEITTWKVPCNYIFAGSSSGAAVIPKTSSAGVSPGISHTIPQLFPTHLPFRPNGQLIELHTSKPNLGEASQDLSRNGENYEGCFATPGQSSGSSIFSMIDVNAVYNGDIDSENTSTLGVQHEARQQMETDTDDFFGDSRDASALDGPMR